MRTRAQRACALLVSTMLSAVACGQDASLTDCPTAQPADGGAPAVVDPGSLPASEARDASGGDAQTPDVSLAARILGADLVPDEVDLGDLKFPESDVLPADLLPPF